MVSKFAIYTKRIGYFVLMFILTSKLKNNYKLWIYPAYASLEVIKLNVG